MVSGDAGISEFTRRLDQLEKAIQELRNQHLFLAKRVFSSLCTIEHNLTTRFLSGEELTRYLSLRSKKLDEARDQIEKSKDVQEITNVFYKFDRELIDLVKGRKVGTEREAMDIAHAYIKKYSPVALPLKAVKEGSVWVVDLDVGALAVKIAKVKVDAGTGEILGHEIPEK